MRCRNWLMQPNYEQRLRLTFRKLGPTRYIGHLDLARTLERSLNRAHIPMAYTQGFNQRPRMQMATALPLGTTSEYELADIWLTEKMDPETARQQLMEKMAPGIDVFRMEEIAFAEPALQTLTVSSHYVATILDPVDTAVLQTRIDALLASETHIRERATGKKRKPYDLRPLILDISLNQTDDALQINMHLSLAPSKTGRPDEVLLTLELDPLAARIHRTKIMLAEDA
ncbi:MAG: DUF2344 domain-containing protein [Chloroflexi bacterium]|nr:MAG: DUF2344 domain-containing protein [Chloroflexota bacterium]